MTHRAARLYAALHQKLNALVVIGRLRIERWRTQLERQSGKRLGTKEQHELDFWTNVLDKTIRETGQWTDDMYDLIGESRQIGSYWEQRRKEGRAQVARILDMAKKSKDYFDGKIVVEIGPACTGSVEFMNARIKIGIEPLAERFKELGLMIPDDRGAVFLTCGAESMPLLSDWADVVVASNSLDHVADIVRSVTEIHRILKPGGELLLNIEYEHAATPTEPHSLNLKKTMALFAKFEQVHLSLLDCDGRKWLMAVFRKI